MTSKYSPTRFIKWYRSILNKPINTDGVFGNQCVDVPKDYSQRVLYPTKTWAEVGLYGDGKDIYRNAKPAYFTKIPASQKKRVGRGDIICWGATKTNKYGHTAVVISLKVTNRTSFTVVEQNGFNPSGVAYKAKRNYNNMVGIVRHR